METRAIAIHRLLALLAACSGLLGGWACEKAGATRQETSKAETSKPALPAFEVSAPGWQDATHYSYQVTLTNRTHLASGNTLVDFQLNAELDLHAIQKDDGTIELASRLRDVRVEGHSQSKKDDKYLGQLARDLEKPWSLFMREGMVAEARFQAGAPAAAVTVQRSLGAALQFAGPNASGSAAAREPKTWTATEYDATGKYQAEYRVAADAGRFSKRKLRYESVLLGLDSSQASVTVAPSLPNLTPEVVGSSADLAVEGGTLRSLKLTEELKAKLGQAMPVTSKTSLTLALATSRREKAVPEWAHAGPATVRVAAGEPYAPPLPPLETDAAKMAGWTLVRAVAELEDLERTRSAPSCAATPRRSRASWR
jgi:hypothetical protein